MPYSNISYTYTNPYNNSGNWSGSPTMSGVFSMNGITLGLDRYRKYEPNSEAPGGVYVTWSAPFDIATESYVLYTNSYHQGISSGQFNDPYVEAYPVCFVSDPLSGSSSGDKQILYRLFLNQQTVGSPRDGSTVYPYVYNPNAYSFDAIIMQFTNVTENANANQYLLMSYYGNYEYMAIWKKNLYYIIDFGWESILSRSFFDNPSATTINNITGSPGVFYMDNVFGGSFFSNEKYGMATMSVSNTLGENVYLYDDGSLISELSYKQKVSFSFWFSFRDLRNMSFPQVILDLPYSSGGIFYNSILIELIQGSGGDLYKIQVSVTCPNYGTDTVTGSDFEINESVLKNYQIAIDLSESPGKIYSHINELVDIDDSLTSNGGASFLTEGGGICAIGANVDSSNSIILNTNSCLILSSFFIWTDEYLDQDLMFQNYYVMKQRYE